MNVAILGAGIAGLECGRLLKELGKDFLIFEKDSRIGGLAKTNQTGKYFWDYGVHAMYSKNKEIFDYYKSLPLNYQDSERGVKIFHMGKNGKQYLVDYPFEEGVKDLPLGDRWDCVKGYVSSNIRKDRPYNNLKDWIDNRLGFGIAKHFMIPYNKKIWNCDLDEISMDLVNKKIDPSSIKNFILGALGRKIIGRIYQWKFIYPRAGVQALMDYTAKDIWLNIRLNTSIERIRRYEDKWVISDQNGQDYVADTLVSTIPLVELLKQVNIDGLEKEYDALKWNDTYFVMVGLKDGKDFYRLKECHWAFFKENEIFYRITLMNNFSDKFAPTLIAEITNKDHVKTMSPEDIKLTVIEDLIKTEVVQDRNDIEEADIKLVNYTYPIPTVELNKVKKEITDKLEEHNIYLVGRNGHWDYVNMDGVIQNVRKLVAEKFQPFPYLEKIVERAEPEAAEPEKVKAPPVKKPVSSKEKVAFALKVVGSLLLCGFLFRKLDLPTLMSALSEAKIMELGIAVVCAFLFMLIRAYKWFYLVRPYLVTPDFFRVSVSYMFGLGISIFTPARIGEIVRITNIDIKERAAPIGLFLFDKFLDILVVTTLAIFGLYSLFPEKFNIFLMSGFFALVVLTFMYMPKIYDKGKGIFERLPFGNKLSRVFQTMVTLPREKIALMTLLTLISYIVCIYEVYFILKAFIPLHVMDVFRVHPVVMLTNIFPFTIGGLGLRETTSIYLYATLGIAEGVAFWGGFLVFVFNTLFYGTLGVILINFSKRNKDDISHRGDRLHRDTPRQKAYR